MQFSTPQLLRRHRCAARLGRALILSLTIGLAAGCGSAETQATADSAGHAVAPSSSAQQFVYRGATEQPLSCTAAQLAARLPPIVYRPAGLAITQKVPLVLALHGSGGTPQSMQGLSHLEQVATRYGFVVVFPASCNDVHPWGAPEDLTYLKSLIPQLIASQYIDPSRVYATGFSAGGYETWLIGCRLSSQVAAIAVVSGAMNGRLYTSCTPQRPVSELLMVGTVDGTRFTGVPGRLPSPFQTTARWRSLDGCSMQPVTATAPLPVVSQQLWSSCTDGTAVSLVLIQGAHHVWPPYGVGAPTNYSASQAVWAFLSAHTGAPLSLTASDARLLSLRATSSGARTRFTATLRVSEPVTMVATLGPSQTPRRTIYLTRVGQRTVTVSWSFRVGSRSSYRVALTFRDSYGRTRHVTRTIVPR